MDTGTDLLEIVYFLAWIQGQTFQKLSIFSMDTGTDLLEIVCYLVWIQGYSFEIVGNFADTMICPFEIVYYLAWIQE